jgi:hypothetical protein
MNDLLAALLFLMTSFVMLSRESPDRPSRCYTESTRNNLVT